MSDLDLSVIVLSFNTKDITNNCLVKLKQSVEYCQKRLGNKIEVIVIDNNSEDGSAQMILQDHTWVKLIALDENTGFSKGNNLGMQKAKYPIFLLLNSDVYVEEESLYKGLAYFRVNLNCDVLGCKLIFASGKFQPSAGNLPNFFNTFFWIFGVSSLPAVKKFTNAFHPTYNSFFAKAHKVGWVTGAFFMLKRKVFEGTSGFDENIFMYLEEVEWCKRIAKKGFKIWYVPQFEVTHLHGASSRLYPQRLYISELKGIKYYFKKHYPNSFLLARLILFLGTLFRTITFILLGKTVRARAYMEGLSYV
ncbi:glycosyltransferase family 2 protein [Candidatus Daviesbacteria bacterium]|nr:glycosyltransferase family 2 protein [Candidatus Daviesbacteria bacterium]